MEERETDGKITLRCLRKMGYADDSCTMKGLFLNGVLLTDVVSKVSRPVLQFIVLLSV
jgi:hypothetical protein